MEHRVKNGSGYDFIDLVKFVLSLMIVALHNSLFDEKIYPWVRVAVPLFFMVSAYFLFVKLKKCETVQQKNDCVKKYAIKNIQLYLFWTVVQLPINFVVKFEFEGSLFKSVLNFIKRIIVGNGFTAAWFLLATVIATLMIYFCSKKLNNWLLLLLSGAIYVLVVFESSYPSVMEKMGFLNTVFSFSERYIASPVFSFPAALVWVALGKCVADEGIKLNKIISFLGTLVFGSLLFAEWRFVYTSYDLYNSDCLFALMPLCAFLFGLILNFKEVRVPAAVTLRKLSVVIYVTHGTSGRICKFVLGKLAPDLWEFWAYLLIILCCIAFGLILIKLQKHIKILKYAI